MNALNSIFKVIVAHEKPLNGIEAASVLKSLAERLENEFEMQTNLWDTEGNVWKFDMLQSPEQMELAVAKTAEADMIIISTDGGAELPGHIQSWLEKALMRKHGEPTALVALLGHEKTTRTTTSHSSDDLRKLAERYNVDFFCNRDHQPEGDRSAISSVLPRAEVNSFSRFDTIHCGASHRGWGIND